MFVYDADAVDFSEVMEGYVVRLLDGLIILLLLCFIIDE